MALSGTCATLGFARSHKRASKRRRGGERARAALEFARSMTFARQTGWGDRAPRGARAARARGAARWRSRSRARDLDSRAGEWSVAPRSSHVAARLSGRRGRRRPRRGQAAAGFGCCRLVREALQETSTPLQAGTQGRARPSLAQTRAPIASSIALRCRHHLNLTQEFGAAGRDGLTAHASRSCPTDKERRRQ